MNSQTTPSPPPKSKKTSFSKLRRMPSLKRSKSFKQDPKPTSSSSPPRTGTPKPSPTRTDTSKSSSSPRKTLSKLSQLKSRISSVHSYLSKPSTSQTRPISSFLMGLYSNPSAEAPETLIPSTQGKNPKPTTRAKDFDRYRTFQTSPNSPPILINNIIPIRPKVITNLETFDAPLLTRISSPESFFTARETISPSITPTIVPSDCSIASSDAIYRFTSPTKFWEGINHRNEQKRLNREMVELEGKELSLCERIRMSRFQKKGEDGESTDIPGEKGKGTEIRKQFLFPQIPNYQPHSAEERKEREELNKSIGFIDSDWIKRLEERYYGLNEPDDKIDGEEDTPGTKEETSKTDDENVKPGLTYWERMDEWRKFVATAMGNAMAELYSTKVQ
ncbi:hypothetical protein TWF718_000538 [Orbilia javanica]|uniref:Uncharacterized protein n=1 Tax=Orbilia javanica TaxID=47235 RepID=A0AAN8MZH2_9PEZI